jgi:transcriptional regulator with XRE-family HTH domain
MARKNKYTEQIDKMIGIKIHELRIALGLSRQQLALKIGVTHQQLQKYEKGTNRISAGRLSSIAKALSKTVSYFYDEIAEGVEALPNQHQRMCIEVSRNFMKIRNPQHQSAVNMLVRVLAEQQ